MFSILQLRIEWRALNFLESYTVVLFFNYTRQVRIVEKAFECS